ncbi:MAG: hypothetical protein DLM72_05085, partial [Candidatus Nitrosopolaris wilkensis]
RNAESTIIRIKQWVISNISDDSQGNLYNYQVLYSQKQTNRTFLVYIIAFNWPFAILTML